MVGVTGVEAPQSITTLKDDTPDDLLITCSSFERDRCLEVARRISGYKARCVVIANPLSHAGAKGRINKQAARRELVSTLRHVDSLGLPRLATVPAYDSTALLEIVKNEASRREIALQNSSVTVDISCLTRPHLAFLLDALVHTYRVGKLRLFYTYPKKYNTDGEQLDRFTHGALSPQPLLLRAYRSDSLDRKRRIAIAILGHEGQRTLTALRRADPEEMLLIVPASNDKELRNACLRQNSLLLQRTSGEAQVGSGARIARESVRVDCDPLDAAKALNTVHAYLLEHSAGEDCRVSLVPFGPKPLLVGAVLGLLSLTRVESDIMYVAPKGYNSDRSSGVAGVHEYRVLMDQHKQEASNSRQ